MPFCMETWKARCYSWLLAHQSGASERGLWFKASCFGSGHRLCSGPDRWLRFQPLGSCSLSARLWYAHPLDSTEMLYQPFQITTRGWTMLGGDGGSTRTAGLSLALQGFLSASHFTLKKSWVASVLCLRMLPCLLFARKCQKYVRQNTKFNWNHSDITVLLHHAIAEREPDTYQEWLDVQGFLQVEKMQMVAKENFLFPSSSSFLPQLGS